MRRNIEFSTVLSCSFVAKPKCPIKKYKSTGYVIGNQLFVHENFYDRIKPLEDVAKTCGVRLYIKGSYYQLPNPAQQVPIADADLAIGHGFQFEVRNSDTSSLCNKMCLSKSKRQAEEIYIDSVRSIDPTDIPEVRCLLQGAIDNGFSWSRYDGDVMSDGTYAADKMGYQALKIDIQTRCQDEKFKRQLMRVLRRLHRIEREMK
jgi:hypothetical protein